MQRIQIERVQYFIQRIQIERVQYFIQRIQIERVQYFMQRIQIERVHCIFWYFEHLIQVNCLIWTGQSCTFCQTFFSLKITSKFCSFKCLYLYIRYIFSMFILYSNLLSGPYLHFILTLFVRSIFTCTTYNWASFCPPGPCFPLHTVNHWLWSWDGIF